MNHFSDVDVWLGKKNKVRCLILIKMIYIKLIKKGQKKLLKIKSVIYDGPIEAPIKKDQKLANIEK